MTRRPLVVSILLCVMIVCSGSAVLAYLEQDTQSQNGFTLHGQTDKPPATRTVNIRCDGSGACYGDTQFYFNSWSTAYAGVGWLGVRQVAVGDWCADGTGNASKASTDWVLQYTGPGPWLRASTGYVTAEDCGNHGGRHTYYALGWHYLDTGPGLDFGTEAYW